MFVVGAVDGGRDGAHLVGGYDEQVDAALDEAVDLLYLTLVAVVGGGKLQIDIAVEVGSNAQLGILLVAPDVVGAL